MGRELPRARIAWQHWLPGMLDFVCVKFQKVRPRKDSVDEVIGVA